MLDRSDPDVPAAVVRLGGEAAWASARYGMAALGRIRMKWERHTEFMTITAVNPVSDFADWGVPTPELDDIEGQLEGQRIAAVRLVAARPSDDFERLRQSLQDPIASLVGGGQATVWTDLRIAADGYAHMLLVNAGLDERRLGRLARRLLEIKTYRVMALLGLPKARELTPQLDRLEARLTDIVAETGTARGDDDRRLLDEVTLLSAEIAAFVSDSRYRFAATAAYAELVGERVAELAEERVEGWQPCGRFIGQRFQPAIRTCSAVDRRMDRLARNIAQAANLLRTRVQVAIEQQNNAVLRSMEERTAAQLRIQLAVESLSIIVISYYLLGLVRYTLESLGELGVLGDIKIFELLVVPVVIGAVAILVRRIRAHGAAADETLPQLPRQRRRTVVRPARRRP